jgi:hypothetical protein
MQLHGSTFGDEAHAGLGDSQWGAGMGTSRGAALEVAGCGRTPVSDTHSCSTGQAHPSPAGTQRHWTLSHFVPTKQATF